jgi:hypothetical protein
MATKTLKKKPTTVAAQILEVIDKHINTVEAIIEEYSYVTEVGMDTELKAANDNLKEAVEDFEYGNTDAEKFNQLIAEMKLISGDDFDTDKILDLLESKDVDTEKLLNLLGSDTVTDHVIKQGYACVKLNNALDRDKLETFLTTEIYPNYLDQQSFLMI